jgi:hypothetical protein
MSIVMMCLFVGSEHFGTEFVDVETGKKENRSRRLISLKLQKFLDIYQQADMYMVHNVPDIMTGKIQWVHS